MSILTQINPLIFILNQTDILAAGGTNCVHFKAISQDFKEISSVGELLWELHPKGEYVFTLGSSSSGMTPWKKLRDIRT